MRSRNCFPLSILIIKMYIIPKIAPPICASWAIPDPPFRSAQNSNAKYKGPKTYAGIGKGKNMILKGNVGAQMIAAKITADTPPDAPRER